MSLQCCFCNQPLDNGEATVTLTQKGCDKISLVSSSQDKCQIRVHPGENVHTKCRLDFTRPKREANSSEDPPITPIITRRSTTPAFIFKEHCFFCGQPAKFSGRKLGYDVIPVRSSDFQESVYAACHERKDEWAEKVLGRLEYARDLHASDAVYHNACNVNFRNGKQIPSKLMNDDTEFAKRQK